MDSAACIPAAWLTSFVPNKEHIRKFGGLEFVFGEECDLTEFRVRVWAYTRARPFSTSNNIIESNEQIQVYGFRAGYCSGSTITVNRFVTHSV